MRKEKAYSLIGALPGSTLAEIEQSYKSKCQKLQIQMMPGQALSIRTRAEQHLILLTTAWEVLQKEYATKNPPTGASGKTSAPLPTGQGSRPLPGRQPNWPSFLGLSPLPNYALGISFFMALSVIFTVIILCYQATAQTKKNEPKKSPVLSSTMKTQPVVIKPASPPVPKAEPKPPAQLRILSVPWCQVELAGKSLGPSGQIMAFQQEAGEYELTLRRNNRTLTRTIRLYEGQQTTVWVQFEKGEIRVEQE